MNRSREGLPLRAGVWGCVIPDGKNIAASHKATPRKNFVAAVGVNGGVMASRVLGCLAGPEGRGDFLKPRVELDSLRQFFDAEINGAASNLVAVGVSMNPV